jgi:hypothetical protein
MSFAPSQAISGCLNNTQDPLQAAVGIGLSSTLFTSEYLYCDHLCHIFNWMDFAYNINAAILLAAHVWLIDKK